MTILHIISSGGMYGAEAVILSLSRALQSEGHTSSIGILATPSESHRQLHDAAVRDAVPAYVLPCAGQVDRALLRHIRELVAATGADVVHAHGYKADVYSFLALRRSGVALVSTCHTWYDNDLLLRVYGFLDRRVLRRYAAIAVVSEEVRQRLLHSGVSEKKVHLVRNGIDAEHFAGAPIVHRDPMTGPLIGLVGRLAPEKGVDVFVAAAAKVLVEFPDARFVAVGEGADRPSLEAQIASLDMVGKFTLPGRQDDMAAVYGALTVMVSASRQEGLPVALLEGMASGLPIVATRVGDVPTLLEDGSTGRLVAAEDPGALAAATCDLLRDPEQRSRLAAAARKRVQDAFSVNAMTQHYLQVYETALAGRRLG